MACRGCLECLLKLLNFLLTVSGLAMVGYGIYLFVEWKKAASDGSSDESISPMGDSPEILAVGRPMLMLVTLSESILDKLPRAWYARPFLFLLISIGGSSSTPSCGAGDLFTG